MDLSFWGFRHWPFARSVSERHLFVGAAHEEACARLLFLVEERRRGGLLSGAAGTGKSCLLRQIQSVAMRLGRLCVRLDATGLDASEFAWQIADGCHTECRASDSSAQVWSSLQARLSGLAVVDQPVVLLIDHFDLIESGCGQTLRRLMQLAESTGADLTVLIAARERFTAPLLLDVVELHVELTAWSESETSRYIADSLHRAGTREAIFTADAVSTIHRHAQGNPARVAWLCDLALLAAMSGDQRRVTAHIVKAAVEELEPTSFSPRDRLRRPMAHA